MTHSRFSRPGTSLAVLGLACAALFSAPCSSAKEPVVAQDSWIQGGPFRLKVTINTGALASDEPVLLVVLHGDLGTDYVNILAAKAASGRDVIGVGLLRPGYQDGKGNVSDGQKGLTTGDNYNAQNTDAIAAAVIELKRKYHARKTVLVGHSGGAAIVGNILGRHPEVADEALMASCPCDVEAWREHMFQKTRFAGFRVKVDTLSPLEEIKEVSDRVPVTLMVGTKDDVAPPVFSKRYRDAGVKFGKRIRLLELEGKDHEILLDPAVFATLTPMLK